MFSKNKIKTKFKANESFDYRNVPTRFETVTEQSIRDLRAYCIRRNTVSYKGEFEPGALKNMLQAVSGQFNHAYTQVDADYSARRNNLESAYQDGLADIQEQIMNLEALIDEHNNLFQDYADAYENISGRRPKKSLNYDDAKLEKIKESYKELALMESVK